MSITHEVAGRKAAGQWRLACGDMQCVLHCSHCGHASERNLCKSITLRCNCTISTPGNPLLSSNCKNSERRRSANPDAMPLTRLVNCLKWKQFLLYFAIFFFDTIDHHFMSRGDCEQANDGCCRQAYI